MTSSLAFQTSVDIANRALQHCRMLRIVAFTDSSPNAKETGFVFDKVREAELRSNLWRFATKRVVLRPIDTSTVTLATSTTVSSGTTLTFTDTTGATTGPVFSSDTDLPSNTTVTAITATTVTLSQAITGSIPSGTAITFGPQTLVWTPPTYSASTTYAAGSVVVDANGEWWQSKVAANLANTPQPGASWQHYTGVDTVQAWLTTNTYFTGELALGTDAKVYMSLLSQNGDGTTGNDPVTTSGFWLLVNGTTTPLSFFYPIGTGPAVDNNTWNVFRLPHGFLRQAPTNPKGSANVWLGAPHGNTREDWTFEGDYLLSSSINSLMLRYIANVVDVPDFDPMFCEMLAARIAEETAPILVTDPSLLTTILNNVRRHYTTERYKAITVNGIEIGPIDPDVDDLITCRM